jgi:hypothetical protein
MLSLSFCVKFRLANDAVVDHFVDNYIPSETCINGPRGDALRRKVSIRLEHH